MRQKAGREGVVLDYSFKKRKLQTIVVLLFFVTMVFVEISTAYADDHVEVQQVGTLPVSTEMGTVVDLVVKDGYAYLAAQGWGLHIINISSPSDPAREWSWIKGAKFLDADLAGNWCYIAASDGSSNSGLYALDTTVTAPPFRYHRFGAGANYSRVCCGPDNKVYAARGSTLEVVYHGESGFGQNPLGSYTVSGSITGIDAAGDLVYIVGDFGLRILDVSVPGTVALRGRCENLGAISDIDVVGNYAYLANGTNGLRVIDISDPANPSPLPVVFKTNHIANGVDVYGNYAYIADGDKGLTVVDVSVPASPTAVASCDTDGTALRVRFADGYIYLADGTGGLKILRLNHAPDKPVNSSPAGGVEVATLTPVLQASAFHDADGVYGDALAAAHWQVCADATCTEVVYDSAEVGPYASFAVPSAAGLQYGKTYWWRVRYLDSRGAWSDWSTATSFTPVLRPPEGLTATPGNGSVILSWDAVAGAAGYNVYCGREGEAVVRWNDEPVTGTGCTVTGLTNGVTYRFQVSAVDALGFESGLSGPVTAVPRASSKSSSRNSSGTSRLPAIALEELFRPVYHHVLAGYEISFGTWPVMRPGYQAFLPSLYLTGGKDGVLSLAGGLTLKIRYRI